MPSPYAHYRFGSRMLPSFPGDVRRTIQRFRKLFDLGLYGPDVFYYATPLLKTNAGFLGIKYHEQSGKDFFIRVCRMLRLERPEAGIAYLYGLLCHYCLDSLVHPFVLEQVAAGKATHVQIETEFDRYLLEQDEKTPPHTQDISPRMKLTPGEYDAVAKFYPPASGRDVQAAVKAMGVTLRLLAAPAGPRRKMVETAVNLTGKELKGMLMTIGPDPVCCDLNEQMLTLYEKAEAQMPELLQQMLSHMTYGGPFGDEYLPPFCEGEKKEEDAQ